MIDTLFLGITPTSSKLINYEDKFDILYNDNKEILLITKKIYSEEEDGDLPAFEYRYVLNCFDMKEMGSEENSIVMECLMCPEIKYVNAKVIDDITDNPEYWYHDAGTSGILPRLGVEYVDYGSEDYDYLTDNGKFIYMLNMAATMIDDADLMRGFAFDRTWNDIGNTGWDCLENLLNGKGLIKSALKRIKESEEY